MDSAFCRRAHNMGIQDANHHCHVNHRGGVHSTLYQSKGGHPIDGAHHRSKRAHGVSIDNLPPKIHCTVFEDNSGALELARLPKIRLRTKHINQSYHHFREHVERKERIIEATPTEHQIADILNKPLLSLLSHDIVKQSWDGRTLCLRTEGSVGIHTKSVLKSNCDSRPSARRP